MLNCHCMAVAGLNWHTHSELLSSCQKKCCHHAARKAYKLVTYPLCHTIIAIEVTWDGIAYLAWQQLLQQQQSC